MPPNDNGEVVLTSVSDDNFSLIQRTLRWRSDEMPLTRTPSWRKRCRIPMC